MLSFDLGTHVACPEILCVFLSSGSRARRIWLGTDLDPRTACRPLALYCQEHCWSIGELPADPQRSLQSAPVTDL